jgi:pyruvate formate lyase activating enzyme
MDSKSNLKQPLVIDIKGNSLDDGPGIRSVVFFKGCPLNCFWCQNPESKKAGPELLFDKEKCVRSKKCIDVCPVDALAAADPLEINRDQCTLCFRCTEACPSKALEKVGKEMSVEEIVAKVIPYKPFFEDSGGGVTLSGGEPTLFIDFLSTLLQRFKQEGIHTLVETAGLFDLKQFETKILPYVDIIYFDIKIIDPEEHMKWCGVDNKKILQNFIHLHELSKKNGFKIKPRTPLIPGINDDIDKMNALADFYHKHGIKQAALLKNNPVWFSKLEKIGSEQNISADDPIRDFYEQGPYDRIKEIFKEKGIEILES